MRPRDVTESFLATPSDLLSPQPVSLIEVSMRPICTHKRDCRCAHQPMLTPPTRSGMRGRGGLVARINTRPRSISNAVHPLDNLEARRRERALCQHDVGKGNARAGRLKAQVRRCCCGFLEDRAATVTLQEVHEKECKTDETGLCV